MLSLPRADIDFREDTQNRLRMLLDSPDLVEALGGRPVRPS
nr:hypothetical protein [Rhodococcus sp. Chr-9]